MNLFADLLLLLVAVPLLNVVVHARPVRPESFTGMHLVTLPVALVLAIAWGIHLAVAPLPWPEANWLLWALWPGHVVAMVFLPLGAYGRRGAMLARMACVAALVAPVLLGHGGAVHPSLPVVGAIVTAVLGIGGSLAVLMPLLRLLLRRLPLRMPVGARAPSDFERNEAEFQRGRWRLVPADAGVDVLLGFTRSFAPEVRQQCLDRLAARSDLARELAAVVNGPQPDEAFHFIVHDCPVDRAVLAPSVRTMLVKRRRELEARMAAGDDQLPVFTVSALECGLAVLEDGGDIAAELAAWRTLLGRVRGGAPFAKTVDRWLRKVARA